MSAELAVLEATEQATVAEAAARPEADPRYLPLGASALGEIPATLSTTGSEGSFTDNIENLRS